MTQCDGLPVRRLVVPALGRWAASWDELVMQAAVPSPFLRSWWLDAVAGQTSAFVLVLEGDTLIGGLAIERRRRVLGVPVYQFTGSGSLCPDHLDLLAARGKESVVRQAIAGWFTERGSRVLDLQGLVENSALEAAFPSAITTIIDVAPWDELPANATDYLASLSSNLRKTVRQAQRRLSAAGVTHRRISRDDANHARDGATALHAFVRLHELREGRGALLREMPRLRPALTAGLARGEVHIDTMEAANRAVLVLISFRLGDAIRLYQSARLLDHEFRDAEAVVFLEVIRRACEDGCRELDMLRGDEPYKSRFVRRKRALRRLRAAHGLLGAIVLACLQALTRARRLAGQARRRCRDHRGRGWARRTLRRAAE